MPDEVGDTRAAPLLIGAKDRFGVGVIRDEAVAGAHELAREARRCCRAPPLNTMQAPVLERADRLFASGDVDDGQAPNADGELIADLGTPRVGPTVHDRSQHRFEQVRVAAGEAGYSAHRRGCQALGGGGRRRDGSDRSAARQPGTGRQAARRCSS